MDFILVLVLQQIFPQSYDLGGRFRGLEMSPVESGKSDHIQNKGQHETYKCKSHVGGGLFPSRIHGVLNRKIPSSKKKKSNMIIFWQKKTPERWLANKLYSISESLVQGFSLTRAKQKQNTSLCCYLNRSKCVPFLHYISQSSGL